MNKKNKVLISTILIMVMILVSGLLYGINFFNESGSTSRSLNETSIVDSEKNQEEIEKEETKKERKTVNEEELRELFGEEVFETKEYYVDDEEVARKAYDDMVKSGLAKQIYLTSIYNNRRE